MFRALERVPCTGPCGGRPRARKEWEVTWDPEIWNLKHGTQKFSGEQWWSLDPGRAAKNAEAGLCPDTHRDHFLTCSDVCSFVTSSEKPSLITVSKLAAPFYEFLSPYPASLFFLALNTSYSYLSTAYFPLLYRSSKNLGFICFVHCCDPSTWHTTDSCVDWPNERMNRKMSKGTVVTIQRQIRCGRWAEESTRDHSKFSSSGGWVDAAAIKQGEKTRFGGEWGIGWRDASLILDILSSSFLGSPSEELFNRQLGIYWMKMKFRGKEQGR